MLAACTYAAVAQNAGTPANNKTFFVAKPGTLVSMFTEDEANSVTHLTLTGKLNAIDFKHLRDEFKNLKVLMALKYTTCLLVQALVSMS